MRSQKVEIVTGYISKTAVPLSGPCAVQKASTGIFWLFAPPGRKFLSVQVNAKEETISVSMTAHLNNMFTSSNGSGLRVIFYNQSGALSDTNFFYTATLAA